MLWETLAFIFWHKKIVLQKICPPDDGENILVLFVLKSLRIHTYQKWGRGVQQPPWPSGGVSPVPMAPQRCVRLSFLLSRLDGWRAIWPFYGESVVYIVIKSGAKKIGHMLKSTIFAQFV